MDLLDRLDHPGPKRILALDGGGVRGVISLELLAKIEGILANRYEIPNFHLCQYFDLIGGTSTGAIIASLLSLGYSVAQIQNIYLSLAGRAFRHKEGWWQPTRRLRSRYVVTQLEALLKEYLKDIPLNSKSIQTGLCIVTKRVNDGHTAILSNHPRTRYYDRDAPVLLRDAVRVSTAAPTYFIPEVLSLKTGRTAAYVDGGVSMANNPALALFLQSVLPGYGFNWTPGEDKLFVVSVGTGSWTPVFDTRTVLDSMVWDWARRIPEMLISDASLWNQHILQFLSRSLTPKQVDQEVSSLAYERGLDHRLLTYARFDVQLEDGFLNGLDLASLRAELPQLRDMARTASLAHLREIGRAAATRYIRPDHLPTYFDIADSGTSG
jgi:uncharacterized protein